MKRELAKFILPLVNDPIAMKELDAYVEYRIELHRDNLEHNVSPDESRGALRELRRFKNLRDEVHGELK